MFDLYDREGTAVSQLMDDLNSKGSFTLSQGALTRLRDEFDSGNCSEEDTSATIRFAQEHYSEVVCPHTAVAIKVAADNRGDQETPMITLATAHAAKFPDAVEAACGVRPELPPHMADLFDRPERVTRVANDLSEIQNIIHKGISA